MVMEHEENEAFSIVIRLRELRKERELSQEDLAEALGISRQSIIALEQGKFLPSLPLVVSMCKFFDTAIEEIMELPFEFGGKVEIQTNKTHDNRNIINATPKTDQIGAKEKDMPNELEPWRPAREMVSLRDAMDRLFEDSFITPRGSVVPRIDIKDKKDFLVVKAELPGLKEEDVDVEVSDGVLTISGETKDEKEEKEEGYYHKESFSGAFSRSISLPSDVIADKGDAEMKNGILMIAFPKAAPKLAKKIQIGKKK